MAVVNKRVTAPPLFPLEMTSLRSVKENLKGRLRDEGKVEGQSSEEKLITTTFRSHSMLPVSPGTATAPSCVLEGEIVFLSHGFIPRNELSADVDCGSCDPKSFLEYSMREQILLE